MPLPTLLTATTLAGAVQLLVLAGLLAMQPLAVLITVELVAAGCSRR